MLPKTILHQKFNEGSEGRGGGGGGGEGIPF